jgi:hypothetical protein
MRWLLPLALLMPLTVFVPAPMAGSIDQELGRLQCWLWPTHCAAALPHYGPPPPPPLVAAPALAPPIAAERPKLKEIVAPKAIMVPERARQKRVERVDRVEHVKDAGLPPCSVIRREYKRMTYAQSIAAYMAATPAQVAYGKRCLGM